MYFIKIRDFYILYFVYIVNNVLLLNMKEKLKNKIYIVVGIINVDYNKYFFEYVLYIN